ncbi:hypothetical protein FA95DRAFT_1556690 [Auriscalpium vulgare]|uniref:Uncharacterized protein n=1 Tax=Auriscalpium vulgare TaxID=40419 RepID=A0ACB8S0F4_9AGAM|nr:hypothetical protein FA95DRAFT_1556690 [Auriscalpium vulgare]
MAGATTITKSVHRQRSGQQEKRNAARNASIRQTKRRQRKVQTNPQWTYVFVGNLSPLVTEDDLKYHFRRCGDPAKVTISCIRGSVASGAAAVDHPDFMNCAAILFKTVRAATAASFFGGTILRGRRIIVSPSAVKLPEVEEVVFAKDYKPTSQAPLRRQATEIITPWLGESGDNSATATATATQAPAGTKSSTVKEPEPPRLIRRNHLFGFSFRLTIV